MANEQKSLPKTTSEISVFLVIKGAERDEVLEVRESEIDLLGDRALNVDKMFATREEAEKHRAHLAFGRTLRKQQVIGAKAKVARQRAEFRRRNPDAVKAAEFKAALALSKHLEAIEADPEASKLPDVPKLRAAVAASAK